jgi:protein phosphatase
VLTTQAGWRSVTGNNRESNEDRCYADVQCQVFLVADGVGGYLGGGQASQLVLETAPREFLQGLSAGEADESAVRSALRGALHACQQAITAYAQHRPELQKMGSTALLAAVVDNTLHIGHLGDSRAYLIRSGRIRQLTTDQTYVQLLVASGAISAHEARSHPLRNILLNSLCVGGLEEHPEILAAELEAGDRVLLATDGLTEVLDDETLKAVIAAAPDPQTAADRLVQAALSKDARDNVTCVVVELAAAD